MKNFISETNRKLKDESLWRDPAVLENGGPSRILLNGRTYLNFASNDYLGYSRHPEIIRAAKDALGLFGAGARSSRLVSGTLEIHQELEKSLARLKNTESALVFPTGFMANLGVISSLLGEGDAVILDRLNHASLIDAAKLSRARIFVYEHASADSLEKVLVRAKSYEKKLVVTDSLFSMDGDFAPLKEISGLCKLHGTWLMIDDAHATGVFGENGSGMADHFGLSGKIDIVMGTLSKAVGSQGGFVCGSKEFIGFLVNRARSYIYTTGLSPASAGAALCALELFGREPERRRKLLELSGRLRDGIRERYPANAGLLSRDNTQIVPFWTGSAGKTLQISNHLKEAGIFAPAIRPPTVPKGECRLRFSLTSRHSENDVERLLEALGGAL